MTPKVLAKWILIAGGILTGCLAAAYVVMLLFLPDPHVAKEVSPPSVDLSRFRLRTLGPRPDDYVGSQVCRECHAEACDRYQEHPMARSAANIADVAPIEDYANPTPVSILQRSRALRAVRADSQVTHHERAEDGSGVLYDMAVPIDIEFGSGRKGRSYLSNHDGILYMSPLTWYTHSQKWGLSPGFTEQYNPRFSRRIVDGCLQCHVGRVQRDETTRDHLRAPYFVEFTLGCERCHGPAGRHVAFHRQNPKPTTPDPIVNPIRLEPARREAVCNQCHLRGVERVLGYKRSEYDFRPGDLLQDVWVTLVQGTGLKEEGTRALRQVEQMESSRCFQKSQGEFGCLSCHDSHGVPSEQERAEFYRQRCLKCHGAGQVECALPATSEKRAQVSDSCIECHLPRLVTTNIPHTAATDHRVLRNPATTPVPPPREDHDFSPFAEGTHKIPQVEVDRARGIYLANIAQNGRNQAIADECLSLLVPVVEANPDDVDALHAMGVAHWVHGRLRDAERCWVQCLHEEPRNERALVNLTFIYHDSGVFEAALKYADALIAVNPHRADIFGRKSHILGRLGRFEEGIEAAHKALEMDPAMAEIHGWLGDAYEIRGDLERSQKHRTLYRRMTSAR